MKFHSLLAFAITPYLLMANGHAQDLRMRHEKLKQGSSLPKPKSSHHHAPPVAPKEKKEVATPEPQIKLVAEAAPTPIAPPAETPVAPPHHEKTAPKSLALGYREPLEEHYVTMQGSFLYWRAYIDETDFITTGPQPPIPSGDNQGAIGTYQHGALSWDSGFRVGLGYCFPRTFWNLQAEYTYYHSHNRQCFVAQSTTPPSMNGGFNEHTGTMTQASSTMSLNYQVADLYLSHRFLPADCLSLEFQFGPTGGWIDERWRIHYTGLTGQSCIKNGFNFHGGGLRIGLNGEWYIRKGIGILTRATIAELIGMYHAKIYQLDTPDSGEQNLLFNAFSRAHRFTTHLQFAMGPSYGKVFKHWGFSLSAAYELNMWFNVQEVLDSILETSPADGKTIHRRVGNLGLQGLTAQAQIHF